MRVSEFEKKIEEHPLGVEIRGHLAKQSEGKRVHFAAAIMTLCRFAYNLGSNGKDLEADPPPPAPVAPAPAVAEAVHGEEVDTPAQARAEAAQDKE